MFQWLGEFSIRSEDWNTCWGSHYIVWWVEKTRFQVIHESYKLFCVPCQILHLKFFEKQRCSSPLVKSISLVKYYVQSLVSSRNDNLIEVFIIGKFVEMNSCLIFTKVSVRGTELECALSCTWEYQTQKEKRMNFLYKILIA